MLSINCSGWRKANSRMLCGCNYNEAMKNGFARLLGVHMKILLVFEPMRVFSGMIRRLVIFKKVHS
jgi:hypothetical protein